MDRVQASKILLAWSGSTIFDTDGIPKRTGFVGPDLCRNCLQRLSADDARRQRKEFTNLVCAYQSTCIRKIIYFSGNGLHISLKLTVRSWIYWHCNIFVYMYIIWIKYCLNQDHICGICHVFLFSQSWSAPSLRMGWVKWRWLREAM